MGIVGMGAYVGRGNHIYDLISKGDIDLERKPLRIVDLQVVHGFEKLLNIHPFQSHVVKIIEIGFAQDLRRDAVAKDNDIPPRSEGKAMIFSPFTTEQATGEFRNSGDKGLRENFVFTS